MRLSKTRGLTYEDISLVPRYSEVKSRSDVDLSVSLSKGIELKTPFIPANMKTIVNRQVIEAMTTNGSMTVMHRFDDIEEQLSTAKWVVESGYENFCGMSVGVKSSDYENVGKFVKLGIKILCIDVAHADHCDTHELTKYIAEKHPSVFLIVGNVSTSSAARGLWLAGADAVKVGQGSGSICLTRIETGNGVAQATAVSEVYKEKLLLEQTMRFANKKIFVIADGGLASAGSCAKALALGADLLMAGNLFGATDEGPGELIEFPDGKKYKRYDGSSTYRANHVEGVAALSEYKGTIQSILEKLKDGVSSSCSYQGVLNLKGLRAVAEFMEVSHATQKESSHHGVRIL